MQELYLIPRDGEAFPLRRIYIQISGDEHGYGASIYAMPRVSQSFPTAREALCDAVDYAKNKADIVATYCRGYSLIGKEDLPAIVPGVFIAEGTMPMIWEKQLAEGTSARLSRHDDTGILLLQRQVDDHNLIELFAENAGQLEEMMVEATFDASGAVDAARCAEQGA